MAYLNEYEEKWIIVLVLDPLSPCPIPLWYLVARQIKWVTHCNSASIKMAVYKPQINGQLVVVVVASAPLIINPITFPSAPVMKVKAIRGWLGCLGNRSKCSSPSREPSLPRCLTGPRTLTYLVSTGPWSVWVHSTPTLHCISLTPLVKSVLTETLGLSF